MLLKVCPTRLQTCVELLSLSLLPRRIHALQTQIVPHASLDSITGDVFVDPVNLG